VTNHDTEFRRQNVGNLADSAKNEGVRKKAKPPSREDGLFVTLCLHMAARHAFGAIAARCRPDPGRPVAPQIIAG
jgi:hypothetical protein